MHSIEVKNQMGRPEGLNRSFNEDFTLIISSVMGRNLRGYGNTDFDHLLLNRIYMYIPFLSARGYLVSPVPSLKPKHTKHTKQNIRRIIKILTLDLK